MMESQPNQAMVDKAVCYGIVTLVLGLCSGNIFAILLGVLVFLYAKKSYQEWLGMKTIIYVLYLIVMIGVALVDLIIVIVIIMAIATISTYPGGGAAVVTIIIVYVIVIALVSIDAYIARITYRSYCEIFQVQGAAPLAPQPVAVVAYPGTAAPGYNAGR